LGSARQRGIDAIHASVELDDPAAAPLLDRAYALLCTYGDSELNYRACQVARTTYGIEHVVAHVSNPIDLPRFTQLGVIATNAAFDSAAVLVMLMRNRAAYQLLTRTDDDKEVFEVPVFSDQFIGKMLRQLSLPGDVLILAIRRDGELLVPHGDTRLNANDYLTLIGSIEHVTTAQQLVSNGQVTLPVGQGWGQ
jgi:Trk K+ transport system NAD-binding subunit